jgi:hypothetical protein
MADEDKTSELYPIAVLIDELKVRYLRTESYAGLSANPREARRCLTST